MINRIKDGFEIYIDDLLLLRHSLDKPCLFIGEKALNMEMTNGEFDFQDETHFQPVNSFKIKDNIIDFNDFKIEVISNQDGQLSLKFVNLNQPVRLNINAHLEERIFGMGEHFTDLNLKGNIVRNWVEEHITRKQIYHKIIRRMFKLKPKRWPFKDYKTYFVAPTFVSSQNYFCHVETYGYAIFDFSRKHEHQISLYSKVNQIDFVKKSSLLELSGALSHHIGKLPKLPDWVYDGMILSIQGGTEVINQKLKKLIDYDAKINGVWSQDWCGELYTFFGKQVYWNWEVDHLLYPNLKEQISKWHKKGIHFLAYINPYLNANGDMYKEALAHDYLVKNADGTPFLTKATSFLFGIVDLTHKDAYTWFKNIIKTNYIDLGIMGWMADFGEYLPVKCQLHSGTAEELHNHWPDLWAKLNREVLEESNLLSSALFFNRAGYKDNSRYTTCIWNGDQHVDFTDDFGMASALRAMLSLSFSGIGFSHSDIGGYTTVPFIKRSKELYIRWLEMNTFTPIMRSHEGNKPWKNVQFDHDDQVLRLTSFFTNIHYMLKPYFLAVENEYQASGYPMIRPLMFHFDYFTDKAFMLGKDLIVFPVLSKGKRKISIHIPEGTWIHLFNGIEFSQGTHMIQVPFGSPAVFYRKESEFSNIFLEISNYIPK